MSEAPLPRPSKTSTRKRDERWLKQASGSAEVYSPGAPCRAISRGFVSVDSSPKSLTCNLTPSSTRTVDIFGAAMSALFVQKLFSLGWLQSNSMVSQGHDVSLCLSFGSLKDEQGPRQHYQSIPSFPQDALESFVIRIHSRVWSAAQYGA
jgi:hypothetical protein